MQNWCKFIVQSPHHKGGYAITPTAASGLAAFYSATAKFVTLLASLPHGGAWVRGGQDLTNGARKTPLTKSALHLLPPRIRCPRSPPLSSFPLLTNYPSCQQPGPIGKMLKTLRNDVACGCPIKGESPAKSCAAGPLKATRVRTGHRNLGPWHCTCATPRRLSTAYLGH